MIGAGKGVRARTIGGRIIALCLLLLSLASCDQPADHESAGDPEGAERERIARFWQAFQEATRHRASGDFLAARDAYRAALAWQPEHEESLFYLGNCLLELGDPVGARDVYLRLIDLNPRSQRAFGQLGLVLQSSFPPGVLDLEGAEQAFRKTAELQPEEPGPYLRLGTLALRRGDLARALEHFSRAAGFGHPDGWFRKAVLEYRLGRPAAALESIRHIFETLEREAAIRRRGGVSEGDRPGSRPSTAPGSGESVRFHPPVQWDAAALQATLLLHRMAAGGNGEAARLLEQVGRPGSGAAAGGWRRLQVFPEPAECAEPFLETSAAADLDGDGRLEVVVLCAAPAQGEGEARGRRRTSLVAVWKMDRVGGARLLRRESLPPPGEAAWSGVWSRLKRVRSSAGEAESLLALGQGEGGYVPFLVRRAAENGKPDSRGSLLWEPLGGEGSPGIWRDACIADLDGDGRDDIIALRRADGTYRLVVYWNRAKTVPTEWLLGADESGPPVYVTAAELDGRPGRDLLVGYWNAPPAVYLNQGGGRFAVGPLTDSLRLGRRWGRPHWLDWDGDGDSDLLLFPEVSPGVSALSLLHPEIAVPRPHCPVLVRNEGGRLAEPEAIPGLQLAIRPGGIWSADFDGDDKVDLLVRGGDPDDPVVQEPARLSLRRGDGFGEPQVLPALGKVCGSDVLVEDLDGDGRVEIVSPVGGWVLRRR